MKNARKVLYVVLSVIAALIVCIAVLIHLVGSSILKTGIETAAIKTLNVGVRIDDMDLSILGGRVSFQNLVIDNPPGYEHDKLLEVGNARIAVSIGSLLKDTVNIKEIMLDGVNVVLEQRGVTGNNLQDVIEAIPKADTKPEGEAKKAGKKLHIDNLEITNVTVKAKLLPIPGKADTVTLKLNPIRMIDLGSDDKLDTAKLSAKILLAIATGVAEQGAGILPEGMTDSMKTALDETAKLGKAAAEEGKKLLEEGKDTGKGLIEGFKGLLKPEK
jgi:uncharacterized protein involved in outer membrane biogenesis